MLSRRTRTYFAGLAVAALSAGSAAAATEYTTQASWVSALTSGANTEALAFANQDLANPTLFVNGYGTFVGDSTAVATTMGYYYLSSPRTVDALQDTTLTVTAPSGGTNASLLWLGANQTSTSSVTSEPLAITLTDVNGNTTTYNLTTGASAPSYFGFTSGTAINTITIAAPTGYDVDLMDFYGGAYPNSPPAPAAECATLLLVAGGLIVLGAKRRFMPPAA